MKMFRLTFILLLFAATCFSQESPLTLPGHTGNVNAIQFSPEGKYLLSGSQDGTIRVWDVATNFSCSKVLTVGSSSVKSISFSTKGDEFLVSRYGDFVSYRYPDFKKCATRKKAHTSFVESANYSHNNLYIITSSWRDNCLSLWKTGKLKKEKDFAEQSWTRPTIFLPDDKSIAAGNHENTIRIWNVETGNIERTLAGHTDWVECIFITNDGKYLVSGSLDKTIRVWELSSGKLFKTIAAHEGGITAMSLSADGKYFASSSLDKSIKLWDAVNFTEIKTLPTQDNVVLCLAFSQDGKYLATAGMDKAIKIWKLSALIK